MATLISQSTEVRKLKSISPSHSLKLVQILDENDAWKFLMSIIPKALDPEQFDYTTPSGLNKKYNADHVKLIENAAKKDKRTPSEIFLFEWSLSGRQRPTVGHLLALLQSANLYRAADYVAINILNQQAPERPSTGPAAKINILDLDAELGNAVNENPQVSNITIENNLDNSKPQNTIFGAKAPKLLLPRRTNEENKSTAVICSNNIPVIRITEATTSLTSDKTLTELLDFGKLKESSVVSVNVNMESEEVAMGMPNISEMLVLGKNNSEEEEDSSDSSQSDSIIDIDSNQMSGDMSMNRPNFSLLLDGGTESANIPDLSGLLDRNSGNLQESNVSHSLTDVSGSSQMPDLSRLIGDK